MKIIMKENKIEARAGDFIYFNGELRMIVCTNSGYSAISPHSGTSYNLEKSLEDLIKFYKGYKGFKIIKNKDITLKIGE